MPAGSPKRAVFITEADTDPRSPGFAGATGSRRTSLDTSGAESTSRRPSLSRRASVAPDAAPSLMLGSRGGGGDGDGGAKSSFSFAKFRLKHAAKKVAKMQSSSSKFEFPSMESVRLPKMRLPDGTIFNPNTAGPSKLKADDRAQLTAQLSGAGPLESSTHEAHLSVNESAPQFGFAGIRRVESVMPQAPRSADTNGAAQSAQAAHAARREVRLLFEYVEPIFPMNLEVEEVVERVLGKQPIQVLDRLDSKVIDWFMEPPARDMILDVFWLQVMPKRPTTQHTDEVVERLQHHLAVTFGAAFRELTERAIHGTESEDARGTREAVLDVFPAIVCQSVYYAVTHVFPHDSERKAFNSNWRRALYQRIHFWTTGVVPQVAPVRNWLASDRHDTALRRRSTVLGGGAGAGGGGGGGAKMQHAQRQWERLKRRSTFHRAMLSRKASMMGGQRGSVGSGGGGMVLTKDQLMQGMKAEAAAARAEALEMEKLRKRQEEREREMREGPVVARPKGAKGLGVLGAPAKDDPDPKTPLRLKPSPAAGFGDTATSPSPARGGARGTARGAPSPRSATLAVFASPSPRGPLSPAGAVQLAGSASPPPKSRSNAPDNTAAPPTPDDGGNVFAKAFGRGKEATSSSEFNPTRHSGAGRWYEQGFSRGFLATERVNEYEDAAERLIDLTFPLMPDVNPLTMVGGATGDEESSELPAVRPGGRPIGKDPEQQPQSAGVGTASAAGSPLFGGGSSVAPSPRGAAATDMFQPVNPGGSFRRRKSMSRIVRRADSMIGDITITMPVAHAAHASPEAVAAREVLLGDELAGLTKSCRLAETQHERQLTESGAAITTKPLKGISLDATARKQQRLTTLERTREDLKREIEHVRTERARARGTLGTHAPLLVYYMKVHLAIGSIYTPNGRPIPFTKLSEVDRASKGAKFAPLAAGSLAKAVELRQADLDGADADRRRAQRDEELHRETEKRWRVKLKYAARAIEVANSDRNEDHTQEAAAVAKLLREALFEKGRDVRDIIERYDAALERASKVIFSLPFSHRKFLWELGLKCKLRLLHWQRAAPHTFKVLPHELDDEGRARLDEIVAKIQARRPDATSAGGSTTRTPVSLALAQSSTLRGAAAVTATSTAGGPLDVSEGESLWGISRAEALEPPKVAPTFAKSTASAPGVASPFTASPKSMGGRDTSHSLMSPQPPHVAQPQPPPHLADSSTSRSSAAWNYAAIVQELERQQRARKEAEAFSAEVDGLVATAFSRARRVSSSSSAASVESSGSAAAREKEDEGRSQSPQRTPQPPALPQTAQLGGLRGDASADLASSAGGAVLSATAAAQAGSVRSGSFGLDGATPTTAVGAEDDELQSDLAAGVAGSPAVGPDEVAMRRAAEEVEASLEASAILASVGRTVEGDREHREGVRAGATDEQADARAAWLRRHGAELITANNLVGDHLGTVIDANAAPKQHYEVVDDDTVGKRLVAKLVVGRTLKKQKSEPWKRQWTVQAGVPITTEPPLVDPDGAASRKPTSPRSRNKGAQSPVNKALRQRRVGDGAPGTSPQSPLSPGSPHSPADASFELPTTARMTAGDAQASTDRTPALPPIGKPPRPTPKKPTGAPKVGDEAGDEDRMEHSGRVPPPEVAEMRDRLHTKRHMDLSTPPQTSANATVFRSRVKVSYGAGSHSAALNIPQNQTPAAAAVSAAAALPPVPLTARQRQQLGTNTAAAASSGPATSRAPAAAAPSPPSKGAPNTGRGFTLTGATGGR